MNIKKAGGITCALEPIILQMLPFSFSALPWKRAKSIKRSGNRLLLHHRLVHHFSRHQLNHTSFRHLGSKDQGQKPPIKSIQIQQTTNIHTNNELRRPSANDIILGNRVKEALANGSPIVALESTVITHGLPEPDNLRLALNLEEKVRSYSTEIDETAAAAAAKTNIELKSEFQSLKSGGDKNEPGNNITPATIGIVKGQIIVGLSNDEIEYLATKSRSKPIKASVRDIPIATALGLSAGTTVSATMAIASSVIRPRTMELAGSKNGVNHHSYLSAIKVFATGGTGGVHMGVEKSLDISADLFEFSKSPIGVVSSGFKSFLDTRRSLEYLETMGCTVISLSPSFSISKKHIPKDEEDTSSLSSCSATNAWLRKHDDDKRMTESSRQQQQFVNLGNDHDHNVVFDEIKCLNNDHHLPHISPELATLKQQQHKQRTDETLFPGFYSQINSQKVKSPHVVKSIEEAAQILFHCLEAPLVERRGLLMAVPIPKMFSLNTEQMASLLAEVSNEVDMRSDIEGKDKTPLVLERFSQRTGGASLRANMELLKNNAQVGALFALEYSKLENRVGRLI